MDYLNLVEEKNVVKKGVEFLSRKMIERQRYNKNIIENRKKGIETGAIPLNLSREGFCFGMSLNYAINMLLENNGREDNYICGDYIQKIYANIVERSQRLTYKVICETLNRQEEFLNRSKRLKYEVLCASEVEKALDCFLSLSEDYNDTALLLGFSTKKPDIIDGRPIYYDHAISLVKIKSKVYLYDATTCRVFAVMPPFPKGELIPALSYVVGFYFLRLPEEKVVSLEYSLIDFFPSHLFIKTYE